MGRSGILLPFVSAKNLDLDARRAAIHCIGCLCIKQASSSNSKKKDSKTTPLDRLLPSVLAMLLESINTPPTTDHYTFCKTICTTLKSVQQILDRRRLVDASILPQLLAVLKMYRSLRDVYKHGLISLSLK